MVTSFLAVGQQVVILFVLILIGFICAKKKFFTQQSISGLSTFVLYIVTPCVIIDAFNRPFDQAMLKGLFISLIAAIGVHLFNIAIAHLCLHDKDVSRQKVLRFGTVFSNCGYMALPLQLALLGQDGVFYGAAFICVFNIVNWTYGFMLMKSEEQKISVKKIFINPGVIGVFIGLVLFFTPIELPHVLLVPLKSLAALNTPLPMIIIGFFLSLITSFAFLKDIKLCLVVFLRLVVSPVAALFICFACGLRGIVLNVIVIAASTPTAANTVMFSALFHRDTELASELVSVSTLISIITMPLIVSLSMYLSNI